MKTSVSEYGYINAKLRSKISLILTNEFCDNLIQSADIESAVKFISENGFSNISEVWHRTADIQNVEFELLKKHIDNYRTVLKNTNGELKSFVKLLLVKPEIDNIKTALRLWYGSQVQKRSVGYRSAYLYKEKIYENIDWTALINAVSWQDVTEVFKNTLYDKVFSKDNDSIKETGPFDLELKLDKLYYSLIREKTPTLNSRDRSIIKQIFSAEIDLQNISWIIRYRHFYKLDINTLSKIIIPGGHGLNLDKIISGKDPGNSDGGFSPIDIMQKEYPELASINISDKHNFSSQAVIFEKLLDEIRKRKFSSILSGYPFTIGIILVYFFMSEREMNFISSVLNGKNYNYTPEKIEELTR